MYPWSTKKYVSNMAKTIAHINIVTLIEVCCDYLCRDFHLSLIPNMSCGGSGVNLNQTLKKFGINFIQLISIGFFSTRVLYETEKYYSKL